MLNLFKKLNSFLVIVFLIIFCQTPEIRCETYEADYIPWSGYWWPSVHGGIATGWDYQGHPSPLEKYDYVTTGEYYGPATKYGREYHYDTEAISWAGLCFCWAAASVLEKEPIHKGIYKETVFRIGDKKGLLTAAYFGTLYNSYSTDEPEQFHQILEKFIADQKIPIIMDLGTGGESWNYPVFKYKTDYTQEENIRHYTTTLYYAGDDVRPDFVGSQINERTFYYYFVLDNDGNITESRWENETVPPVNASEPFGTECLNTGLDYDQVKEIVYTDDDSYEANDSLESALELSTGHYMLLAINSDYFKVHLKKGDKLNIRAESKDGYDFWLRTYMPDGNLITETKGNGEQIILADEQDEGAYFFEIAPIKASSEPEYEIFLQYTLSYQGIFPIYPSGQWQNGIALLSPDKSPLTPMRTMISLLNKDGSPQISFTDDSSRLHLRGMAVDDFGLYPLTDTGYVRVDSDAPFCGLQIATAEKFDLLIGSNFVMTEKASPEIFFPHFAMTGGWQTRFGIINTGNQTEEIFLQSYDENGDVLGTDTLQLGPGEKSEKDSSSYLILVQGAKSMSAAVTSQNNSLIGYLTYLNPSSGSKGRDIVPLTGGQSPILILPHIASDGDWWTGIAVMNTGTEETAILCSAYDAQGNLLDTVFQVLKAKQNFVRLASEIFPGILSGNIASMKIISQNNQPLCGLMLYGTDNGFRLAGIPIHPMASSLLYLPHIACVEPWWTGISVMNVSDVSAEVSFSLFQEDGNMLDLRTIGLNPNQRWLGFVTDMFDPHTALSAGYMKIESDKQDAISGIYVMGTKDGLRLMGDQLMGIGN